MHRTFLRVKQVWFVAAVLLVTGCATAAQRQYQAMGINTQAVIGGFKSCVAALYSAPEAAPLRPHIPRDVRDLTLAQLSDRSFTTNEENNAIFLLYPRLQQCQKTYLDGLSGAIPSFVPILSREYIENEDSVLLLVQRKQSWGDFSKRRRDMELEAQSQIQAEARRVIAGLEQSHEAELARRQAAIQATSDALARWGQTQQIISNMNRGVNCTTMAIRPGFSTTNCY
jgi:hypothetical protein